MFAFKQLTRVSVVAFLIIAASTACHEGSLPTAPPTSTQPPPAAAPGAIYGIVVSARDHQCLVGATVEMLDGPRAGERVQQTAADCQSIFDTSVHAFIFRNVPLDKPITLRASMPGYESRTVTRLWSPETIQTFSSSVEIGLDPLP